ncbi:Isochorismatase-like protein [Podospora fimiseda]|uniref:Isochorismatase-like protein n=1 Tax=Podospora fimiseda TaxID=252190 RepID=A0AAN7GV77_9PEZI|nr:Isochorismatase-like protein [Podospora fimiseda]
MNFATRTCLRPILASNTRASSLFTLQHLKPIFSNTRLSSTMATPTPQRRFKNPSLFICDIQTAFSKTIYSYPLLLSTVSKLIKFCSLPSLQLPIYITTQSRAKLGDTHPSLLSIIPPHLIKANVDKTKFSMALPPILEVLPPKSEICLVGIESHICVTQTALDLVREGHKVYVMADGVSSSNKEEVGIALERLRREGVVVTSSESWMYELVGDAEGGEFKEVIGLVKESMGDTRRVMEGMAGVGSKI